MNTKLEDLLEIRTEVEELKYPEERRFNLVKGHLDTFIRKQMNEDEHFLAVLGNIYCQSYFVPELDQDTWDNGIAKLLDLIDQIKKYLPETQNSKVSRTENVFIVHGHEIEMKEAVARLIEKQGLKARILHEQPDESLTIIEKLEKYISTCSFAIVLLTPDDWGGINKCQFDSLRPRARQNIILELGWVIGALGRGNVCVLYRETPNFELPSDIHGILYKRYDIEGNWKYKLLSEMKAAGFNIDSNRVKG